MQEERDKDRAELVAMHERIRQLHEQGELAHRRFVDARADQDQGGMRRAAREHVAINREAAALINRVRQRITQRVDRLLATRGQE
jgi:hypothetical protein